MRIIVLIVLTLSTQIGFADWSLNNKASSFNYISTKNSITDANSFSNLDGDISDQGEFTLRVDLSSIDTNNSNRNIQIQDLFLETRSFQEASFSINLNKDFLNELVFAQARPINTKALFMFHGVIQHIDLNLLFIRLQDDFLIVKTLQPVLLNLTDFGLAKGLATMREIEVFKNINDTVPISLNLFFKKN